MNRLLPLLLPALLTFSSAYAAPCDEYLLNGDDGARIGVTRIESLFGRPVRLIDLSDVFDERHAPSDSAIRVINLRKAFSRAVPVIGFGRPNVWTGMPASETGEDLRYEKIAAKSFWMGQAKIEPTRGNVQSGVLAVLPDADEEANERLFEAARARAGKRSITCVNFNCQVLADAGYTVGGESLRDYYFPVALMRDVVRYGLEHDGRPVRVDFIRTTPNYLEDVGLSINHAVFTTLCRHARRSCEVGALKPFVRNPWLVKIDTGARRMIDVGFLPPAKTEFPARPRLESKPVPMIVAPADERRYTLRVTEPSPLGTAFRMLWGPHTIFEIELDPALVNTYLPNTLRAFPQPNPGFVTRIKKRVLIAPFVTDFFNRHLKASVQTFTGLTQRDLFDMIRTDSPSTPNPYNFVVTGKSLLITKNVIRFGWIDWYLSKHVMVSNYDADVRLGGSTRKDERAVVHLKGDSGTYHPKEMAIQGGAGLFREVFPGVPVEVDPLPEAE